MRIMADLASAPAPSNRTVVSVAYDRLRRDIMNGVLEPGRKLKFNELSEAYGVGVGTLREALHKLAADGLVDAEERRGFTVEQLSPERMRDAAAVRILLEEEALRRSIEFGDVEWEVDVLGAFRRLERWSEGVGKQARHLDDRWQALHRDFHRALGSACRSPMLMELRDAVFARWERYSRLFLTAELHDSAGLINNIKEHRAIKDAALARDADRAAMLLRRHFEGTRELVLEWLAGRKAKEQPARRRPRARAHN
jgi:GntR family transcriptional regulator, carbon starvation induced regulator